MAELHGTGIAAVLSADAYFQRGVGLAAFFHADADDFPHPRAVNGYEGVVWQNPGLAIERKEFPGVVPGEAEDRLGEVIRPIREKLGQLRRSGQR